MPDTFQLSEREYGTVQMSCGMEKTGNDHSEDLHDAAKMNLTNDLGQHEEETAKAWMKWKGQNIDLFVYLSIG